MKNIGTENLCVFQNTQEYLHLFTGTVLSNIRWNFSRPTDFCRVCQNYFITRFSQRFAEFLADCNQFHLCLVIFKITSPGINISCFQVKWCCKHQHIIAVSNAPTSILYAFLHFQKLPNGVFWWPHLQILWTNLGKKEWQLPPPKTPPPQSTMRHLQTAPVIPPKFGALLVSDVFKALYGLCNPTNRVRVDNVIRPWKS